MKVRPTTIPDVMIISLDVVSDTRGHFFERFRDDAFAKQGLPNRFRQENQVRMRHGVVRGLHYQLQRPVGRLIDCIRGSVFYVAADIRVGGPTYGKWVGVELHEERKELLWIPPGMAHGFCALAEGTELQYRCTDLLEPWDEHGIIFSDAELAITWPVADPILSDRDWALPTLERSRSKLPKYQST